MINNRLFANKMTTVWVLLVTNLFNGYKRSSPEVFVFNVKQDAVNFVGGLGKFKPSSKSELVWFEKFNETYRDGDFSDREARLAEYKVC